MVQVLVAGVGSCCCFAVFLLLLASGLLHTVSFCFFLFLGGGGGGCFEIICLGCWFWEPPAEQGDGKPKPQISNSSPFVQLGQLRV